MNDLKKITQHMDWWGVVEFMSRHHPHMGRMLELARCTEWSEEKLVLSFPDTKHGWEIRHEICNPQNRDILEGHLCDSGYPIRVTTLIY